MAGPLPTARLKRLQAVVRRYALDRSMLPRDGRILLAVSGGPDSTALLILMARLSQSLNLTLHVAHYDHGLRARRIAQREERFVRALAELYGLDVTVGHGDVRAVAKAHKLSLEEAARRERYGFLAQVAADTRCRTVATGHTAADQAETVVMHIVRGSGLAGLAGMASVAPWPFAGNDRLRLVRPLLRLTRADTEGICADAGVTPMQDETNASPRFRRNRVRMELMPLLRELNPRVDDALVRLADASDDDYAFIHASASAILRKPSDGAQRLVRRDLVDASSSMRRHALRIAIERAAGDLQDFGERHFAALDRLVLEGKTGDRLDLPRDLVAELRRRNLHIQFEPLEVLGRLPDAPARLTVPGFGRIGRLAISVTHSPPPAGIWSEVDAGAIEGHVTVRRRLDGDRFQPLGMHSTKKLQDFLVDAHVPRRERDCIPMFECERGIVWVGGLRIADWARPKPGKPTLFLSYEGYSPP
jgi:tRNA(Ile)-lysidine synthase